MDINSINVFMKGLKKLTMETGVAVEWSEHGINLIDVQRELDDGRYTWVHGEGVAEARAVMWEYEGEEYDH
jgi:predicted RNA-binding protein